MNFDENYTNFINKCNKKFGDKYNLSLEGVEFKDKEEVFKYPFSIVEINVNSKTHFVIFEKIKKNKVKILDPSYGETIVTKDWFLERFMGVSLIYKESKKCDFKVKFKAYSLPSIIIYISSLFVDYGLLYLLSFVLKDDHFMLEALLATLGILISFIAKELIIKNNYRLIDKMVKPILSDSISKNEIKELLSFKSYLVKYIYNLINSMALVLFALLILLKSDILNIILILIVFGGIIINYFIEKNQMTDKKYELAILEDSLLSNETKLDENNYNFIAKTIDSIINKNTLFIVIMSSVSFVYLFLINYFNQYNSLSFLLFYFGVYLLLISKFSSIINETSENANNFRKITSIIYRLNSVNK